MTSSQVTAIKKQLREATETPGQTRAEAAMGNNHAAQKLARKQAAQATLVQPAQVVDSPQGKLNTSA